MRICVEVDLEAEAAGRLSAEIKRNWAPLATVISPREDIPRDAEGLLVVGQGREGRSTDGLLLIERMGQASPDLAETLFQVNAKLGRMTSSDLAKSKVFVPVTSENNRLSRRDLFLGLRGGIQRYVDAPVVFDPPCEAKFSCSKCVDVCPSQALAIEGGVVLVNELKCTRCGECAAVCPVSAIQLPTFSEEAFRGMLDGLNRSAAPRKTLVLACEASTVDPMPWVHVERVKDVGRIGTRQLAMAAASSLSAIVVYCQDGSCAGLVRTREAVKAVRAMLKAEDRAIIEFLQGEEEMQRFKGIMSSPVEARVPTLGFGSDPWNNYIHALQTLSRPEAQAAGLGLTDLQVDSTCTLCGSCVKSCPHVALALREGSLVLDSSRCTGCGYCAEICPEHSITLRPLPSVSDMKPRTIFQDVMVKCARCGKPLESAGLLRKVATLVGDNPMLKYCSDCKQILAFESVTLNQRGKENQWSKVADAQDQD